MYNLKLNFETDHLAWPGNINVNTNITYNIEKFVRNVVYFKTEIPFSLILISQTYPARGSCLLKIFLELRQQSFCLRTSIGFRRK